jgi:ABC-2 type transport system ATP-binding protein
MPIIHIQNLVKDFRVVKRGDTGLRRFYSLIKPNYITKHVINIPRLDIEAGEVVGYVGANGAGKSTTIKMLSGILTPTSGTIEVAGLIPWKHHRQNAFNIGVVFGQRSHLWWDLPLIESFKLIAKIYTISQQRYQQNLDRFVAMLDMASFLETPVRQLSLGQRMRGDLVAAMLYEPPILFLDEPTIGLDVLAKESIRCFIEEENKLKRTTVMLTTHDLSDVERLCSRIVLIDEGYIIYDGAIADLKSRYTKKRQFAVQLEDPTVPVDIVGATVIGRQNTRVFFEYDPATTAIPTLISAINQSHQIIDLSITEPDLESIIRQIYRKNDHHEELDHH